jgi:hypothetical protein
VTARTEEETKEDTGPETEVEYRIMGDVADDEDEGQDSE